MLKRRFQRQKIEQKSFTNHWSPVYVEMFTNAFAHEAKEEPL